jgi:hypothetical protein
VFESRVLRRIFGPKRDGEREKYKKFDNNDVRHDLYSSPNIIGVVKPRRKIWAMHLARKCLP